MASRAGKYPQNLVAISGAVDTDTLVESYGRVLRDSGYSVEVLQGDVRRKRKRSVQAAFNGTEYAGVFCLQEPCRKYATSSTVNLKVEFDRQFRTEF